MLGLLAFEDVFKTAATPLDAFARNAQAFWQSPLIKDIPGSGFWAASWEMFSRAVRPYPKPPFNIYEVKNGQRAKAKETVVWENPFCQLIRFGDYDESKASLAVIAPIAGHHASLVRDTIEPFVPHFNTHVTDWVDPKEIPSSQGRFGLNGNRSYLMDIFQHLGPRVHVMAICQAGPASLAATALLHQAGKTPPLSLVIAASPIDTRENPTVVNTFAKSHSLEWFEKNMLDIVPPWHPGAGRIVRSGSEQVGAFLMKSWEDHVESGYKWFNAIATGDKTSAEKSADFYGPLLSGMNLPGGFFIQTVDQIFHEHALPNGVMEHQGTRVNLKEIKQTAIMTVEGRRDDVCGVGQTKAALSLTPGVPDRRKKHVNVDAGHYGPWSGSRWRNEVFPKVLTFMKRAESPTRREGKDIYLPSTTPAP